MKRPQKPEFEKLPGVLRRLLGLQENRAARQPGISHWSGQSATDAPTQTRVVDKTSQFKMRVPRNISSTPLQNPTLPHPASHVSNPSVLAPPPARLVTSKPKAPTRRFFELAKTLPAFWTVASLISLLVNVILIVVLALLGREFFVLKAMLGDKLLGGLYENFIYMDQAHIQTNITVADSIPINFNLPISQDTVVVLTQDTVINGANVRINTGGVSINSSANIVLPAGTNLPVHLEINVPVTTTVPIKINVPVDIPLQQTELHKPFIGLQQVVAPFYNLLQPQMKNPLDMQICEPYSALCADYFK